MAPERFVTHKDLADRQKQLRDELMEDISRTEKTIENVDKKVQAVDDKVSTLQELVLPLTVAMNATAENTKKISQTLEKFTEAQSDTNQIFNDRIGSHSVDIENLRGVTNSISDRKKYNATVVVALIGLVGTFIVSLFGLAPLFFP